MSLQEDASMLGIPQQLTPKKPKEFELWQENWPAFEIFLALQTQWKYIPMGGIQGLDYSAVKALIDIYQPKKVKRVFQDIQAIESGFLAVVHEKQSS